MPRTKAQLSRDAIERIYVSMSHLSSRGKYKPLGASGEALISALKDLNPEIYGDIRNPESIDINGVLYVTDRLPNGIEKCTHVKLISREGYADSSFKKIIPLKRRRVCYQVDSKQMYIEMTRGKSDVYDILTHLTYLYIEAEKIKRNALDSKGEFTIDWIKLEEVVLLEENHEHFDKEAGYTYLSNLIGKTYAEVVEAIIKFESNHKRGSLFSLVYHLGKVSIEEDKGAGCREIHFSTKLRQRLGHHVYGELWANSIKTFLHAQKLLSRPIHIISANLHSVVNTIYGTQLYHLKTNVDLQNLATKLSSRENKDAREALFNYAFEHGLSELEDNSGTNINVQIIDTEQLESGHLAPGLQIGTDEGSPIILVMDYAFGEQAYECMDELLKPYEQQQLRASLDIRSISIMGKAGILRGKKGDIMIPSAHVFEGTADNYPFENGLNRNDFKESDADVYEGTMITVLGTSLQNKDILHYFRDSSWDATGLEMEGAHYQKAIQAASKIRKNISEDVKLQYAYYASDNPLETGSTLASGGLGLDGVKPTYLITQKILEKIFEK